MRHLEINTFHRKYEEGFLSYYPHIAGLILANLNTLAYEHVTWHLSTVRFLNRRVKE